MALKWAQMMRSDLGLIVFVVLVELPAFKKVLKVLIVKQLKARGLIELHMIRLELELLREEEEQRMQLAFLVQLPLGVQLADDDTSFQAQ